MADARAITQQAGVLTEAADGDALEYGYASLAEQAGDPAAGAGTGKIYLKDAGGVAQLFYRADDGTVYQLTPTAGGGPTTFQVTAGEDLDPGEPVAIDGSSGTALAFRADVGALAVSARRNFQGTNTQAVLSGALATVQVDGEIDIPDVVWQGGAPPAAASAGARVYLSATAPGLLTPTAPSGASESVFKVAVLSRGGAGAARIVIQPEARVDLT